MAQNPFPDAEGFANVRACRRYAEQHPSEVITGDYDARLALIFKWAIACSTQGPDEARAYAPVVALASAKLRKDSLREAFLDIAEGEPLDAPSLGKLFALAAGDTHTVSQGVENVLEALPLCAEAHFTNGLLDGASLSATVLAGFVDSDVLGSLSKRHRKDEALGAKTLSLAERLVSLTSTASDLLVMFESDSVTAAIQQRLRTTAGPELWRILAVISYSGGEQYRELLTELFAEAPDEETRLRLLLAILATKWSSDEEGEPHVA